MKVLGLLLLAVSVPAVAAFDARCLGTYQLISRTPTGFGDERIAEMAGYYCGRERLLLKAVRGGFGIWNADSNNENPMVWFTEGSRNNLSDGEAELVWEKQKGKIRPFSAVVEQTGGVRFVPMVITRDVHEIKCDPARGELTYKITKWHRNTRDENGSNFCELRKL